MKQPPPPAFSMETLQELFTNHELLHREAHRPKADAVEGGVRRVGILGGGTAGWFTALALRAQLPWLDVTLIESKSVPIIGVGEASVPSLLPFLHHHLALDVREFTQAVRPTWKQGIRFEWGQPGDYAFQAPFDWEANGVGMLGAMAELGNVSAFTLQGALMARDKTAILRVKGQVQSYLPVVPFAYHLDNERLVSYLAGVARARGVHHVVTNVVDAEVAEVAGEPTIHHLVAEDGQTLAFDLYVDCSGFRSLLLGDKLGESYRSYASSLFTDAAVAFNVPHGGALESFTTARTMDHGWCWNIPTMDDDHHGYVHSSAHCSSDEALAEARAAWPNLKNERVIRFRSGRHERMWVGNVFAVGNAYAFVEPLESTGLLMITRAIGALTRAFPIVPEDRAMKRFVNASVGRDWDRLRWFLAAHYKFNERSQSRFWKEVRDGVDLSGLDEALALYRERGPLSLLPRTLRASLLESVGIFFYGLHGLDCILLGQKVPHRPLEREASSVWRARREAALDFARKGLPQAEAHKAVAEHPEILQRLVHHPSSWVAKIAPFV